MARPDYVPRTHANFDAWQRSINQFVVDNAAAWAIDAQTVTDLTSQSTAFDGLYKRIENRQTRTLQEVADFNQFRITFTAFLRQLVQGSLVNNTLISYADKIAMGLNPRTGSRTERPTIITMPVIKVAGLGGGLMEFVCDDSADGRAARPANADGVELVITINTGKTLKLPENDSQQEDETLSVIEEQLILTSSKTRVRKQFTEEQRGKAFSIKGRWYNNTDRSKDGQYGSKVSGFVG